VTFEINGANDDEPSKLGIPYFSDKARNPRKNTITLLVLGFHRILDMIAIMKP
jgi:hypothetical protein